MLAKVTLSEIPKLRVLVEQLFQFLPTFLSVYFQGYQNPATPKNYTAHTVPTVLR